MILPPQPGRGKAAVASSSNAPRPGEARYLCCGGLDAGCTCASQLCRLEGGPHSSQNVPRVCLLAVHDTCTMPISRARSVVRECRCSVEAAHVRSDETLLGTRTRDGVVRFGLLQGPSRQCRAFASTMFQCGDAKHQSVPAAQSLILMRTKCKIFVSMCPGSTERTVNWSVCTPH